MIALALIKLCARKQELRIAKRLKHDASAASATSATAAAATDSKVLSAADEAPEEPWFVPDTDQRLNKLLHGLGWTLSQLNTVLSVLNVP